VIGAAGLADVRGALLAAAVSAPSRAASGLAFLAARVEDAPPGPQCPQPLGGAGALEASEWAGLWYGGRHDCFPGSGVKDGPTLRKRRSRAVGQLHDVLIAAAAEANLAGDDDG
jgi:hypothetical protein